MGTGVSASYGFAGSITEAQWAVLNQHPRGDYVSGCALSVGTGAREVDVASGTVWQLGGYHSVSGATVTFAENTSGSTRIDTIVLAVDYSSDDAALTYVQGTPSAAPVPPTLTRTAGTTWQVPLADVTVANGAGVLTSSAVQDVRAGPWVEHTPDSPWTNLSTPTYGALSRRLAGSTVQLRGLLRITVALTSPKVQPMLTVPYRWRPSTRRVMNAATHPSFVAPDPYTAVGEPVLRVDVDTDGTVAHYWPDYTSAVSNRWGSVSGLSWDISDNGRL